MRTAAASVALQLYPVTYLLIFTPWSEWKATAVSQKLAWALAEYAAGVLAVLVLVFYLGDADRRCPSVASRTLVVCIPLVLVLFAVAESQRYAAGVLASTLLCPPLLTLVLQRTVLAGRDPACVLELVSVQCVIAACWTLAGWVCWVGLGNRWVLENRIAWTARLGCSIEDAACLQHAYVLWVSGATLGATLGFFAVVTSLLARSTRRVPRWQLVRVGLLRTRARGLGSMAKAALEASRAEAIASEAHSDASNAAKIVGSVLALGGVGIYCASAIAGAGMELAHAFTAVFTACLVVRLLDCRTLCPCAVCPRHSSSPPSPRPRTLPLPALERSLSPPSNVPSRSPLMSGSVHCRELQCTSAPL